MFNNIHKLLVIKKYKIFIASIVISFFFICLRNFKLYPSVFTDEQFHSYFARLVDFKNIEVPSYIFYLLYKSTNFCGETFLECGRLLNTLFFIIGCILIYKISKKYTSFTNAILIFLLISLGPLNIYTAYFMPESLYFLFFFFYIYFLFYIKIKKKFFWFINGVILGFMSLVKPHALFLIPCIIIYLIWIDKKREIKIILLNIFYLIFFFFITKIFFQILFIGNFKDSLTIFGKDYNQSLYHYFPKDLNYLVIVFKNTLINIKGNLLFLSLIFYLPIILCIKNILTKNIPRFNKNLSIFIILIFSTLIIIFGIFTGSGTSVLDYEKANRLNTRYFYFLYPLFLILIFCELSNFKKKISIKNKIISSLFITIFIIYSLLTQLNEYVPTYHLVDGPLYRGFTYNKITFNFLTILGLSNIILWFYKERLAIKFYCYFFLVLTFFLTSIPSNIELTFYKNPTIYDNVAIHIKKLLLVEKNKNLLIISEEQKNIGEITKILFHLDNIHNSYKIIKNFEFNKENITTLIPEFTNESLNHKNSIKWVLLINYKNNINFPTRYIDNNFILFNLSDFK
jgi:phosphoglycerol transferase